MSLKPIISIGILLTCLLASTATFAQQTKEQLAAHYYSHGEYAQAAEIYEGLYKNTSNKFYYQMLLKSYLELGQIRDAERLVEKRMKDYRRDIYLHVDLAEVLLKKGDKKKADKEYEEALNAITADMLQVEDLVRAFEGVGRSDLMLKAYLKAREVMKSRFVYVNEIAALHGSTGNYEAMTQEYLDLLDNSPGSIGSIQISLQRAMQQTSDERLSDGLRSALISRIQDHPENRSYIEMMIWYSLQVKDFEFAMTQAKAVDARFPDMGGEQLYRVANIALSNADYDVAEECYRALISKGTSSPQYFNSRIGVLKVQFARLNRNFPTPTDQLQALRQQYDATLQELGKKAATLPIMRDYASLMAYYLNDVQGAADMLYDALEIPKLPQKDVCQVKLELGDLLLFAGEPWEASLLYMQVEKTYRDDILGAQAKLRNARLSYYNNDFQWAISQLNVLRASTTKLIANDAMELSLLISDNMEDDSTYGMLELYAAADLMLYRNQLDSAWQKLDEIAQRSLSHPLLDEVLMQKAKIRMRQNRFEEADSLLAKLYDFYPDDILADDALMLRAQLNEERLQHPEVAKECYEKILVDYPVSLYADRARKRYNALRK